MNDEQLIWECYQKIGKKYELVSEIPASLEFASDTLKDKLDSRYTTVSKATKTSKARQADINIWKNPKFHSKMKEIAKATSKGLDKKRMEEGKPPIMWRLIDLDLEKGEFLVSKYDLRNDFRENPNLLNDLKSPNTITIFMNPTGLDDKKDIMAFSSWIRSHKCGHAVLIHDENYNIDEDIKEVLKQYHNSLIYALEVCTNSESASERYIQQYPIFANYFKHLIGKGYQEWKSSLDYYNVYINFLNDFCTFGSARNKKLREQDVNEEFVAQLMQTGKIKINKMLDNEYFDYRKMLANEYHSNAKDLIEMLFNKLSNIESFLENKIEEAIDNCVGEVLYDLN